jgi:GDSL-like Lipase/Acylhydrolase family
MTKRFCFLFFACWLVSGSTGVAQQTVTNHFEKEIAAFEAADRTNPPPRDAIEFLGASTIRFWRSIGNDFPGHKVFNRGFGGSQISDSIFFFDRIVVPYKPKMIVFYAGSNDINAGKTPDAVAEDFRTLAHKVESALPGTKLAFISINAAPSRFKDVEKIKKANQEIADFIAKDKQLLYIDTFSAMLDSDGHPRRELYRMDNLHPNGKGYAIWAPIVAPYLNQAE